MTVEFELKLDLDVPDDAGPLLRALSLVSRPPETLRATYFDTADDDLARLGFALRIRQEGRRRVQTLKADGGRGAGAFARHEWERPVRGNRPVLGADSPVIAALGGRVPVLEPRFEVVTNRTVSPVETDEAVIEMALDRGEARAGEAVTPFAEIELELKRGDEAAVFALARRIGRLTPVRLGVLAKVDRARRLLRSAGAVDKAGSVPLSPDMSAEDAFRVIVHACIRHYRLNEERLLAADDAAALHQARVALRRLRSAMAAFRPIAKCPRYRRLKADLRWLTGQLGRARNIDVLIPRVHDERTRARLEHARGPAYAEARRAALSPLSREMMLDLAEWIGVGKWRRREKSRKWREALARDYAARAISRLHDRLTAKADAIAGFEDEQRHEARKIAKKLRYTVEFFALLFDEGKERKARMRYLAALEELQDHLGALNDLAVMPQVLEELDVKPEQAARAVTDFGERDYHILQAVRAMVLVVEAKRFWE